MPQELLLGFYTKVSNVKLKIVVFSRNQKLERKRHFVMLLQFWRKDFYDVHPFFMLCSPPKNVATRVVITATICYNQSSLLMLKAQENTTGLKEPVMSRNETNGPLKHVKANAGPNFNRYCCLYLQQLHSSNVFVASSVCKIHVVELFIQVYLRWFAKNQIKLHISRRWTYIYTSYTFNKAISLCVRCFPWTGDPRWPMLCWSWTFRCYWSRRSQQTRDF